MSSSEKQRVWRYIQMHPPHQESFIRTLRKSFGGTDLVSFARASYETVLGKTVIKEGDNG